MSNLAHRRRKFLECTSRIRIHGHGRRLGDTGGRETFLKGVRWELKTD